MKSIPLTLLALLAFLPLAPAAEPVRPNIVLIYADDLGYGDLGCYGATAVKTPNCDRLAKEGLRFTSAYATSATCTPSRYSMLTGEYAFRQKGTGILPGDAAMIIQPGRTTLPSVLKQAGYATGVVGKWHLGLGDAQGSLDWNGEVKPGPLEIGFDRSFIMAATGDRVPCVYVEDHRVVGLDPADPIEVRYSQPIAGEPNGVSHRAELRMDWSHGHNMAVVNGIGRIGYMKGGKSALWRDEDMADVFTRQAVKFIEDQKAKPFFLYFATHDIHVPRVPHPRFAGTTGMGPRGDVIAEFDASVGAVLETLDRLKLSDSTLVILSSDNGPVLDDGYKDEAVEKLGSHKPSGPLRGGKYSIFEGGTRVPFIVRWPARVKPGVSDALVSQVDLLASFATLTGQTFDAANAPDTQDVLPALLGESKTGRDYIVQHAGGLAVRKGDWKFLPPGVGKKEGAQAKPNPAGQLYNLAKDPGETSNVIAENPEKAAELKELLASIRAKGAAAQ